MALKIHESVDRQSKLSAGVAFRCQKTLDLRSDHSYWDESLPFYRSGLGLKGPMGRLGGLIQVIGLVRWLIVTGFGKNLLFIVRIRRGQGS